MQDHDGWYIARDNQQIGPITAREMQEFIRRGHLKLNDHIWRPGFDNWRRASDVPGLISRLRYEDSAPPLGTSSGPLDCEP
jgi:hypothetical protein